MKCAIVVLALTGLAAASPEADPQLFVNSAALPYAAAPALFNPNPYSNFLYAPRPAVAYAAPVPYAAPLAYAVPETPVTSVSSIAPINPFRKAGDCVTAEGCAVRDLIDAGLTGQRVARSADAEPEADAQFLPYNFGLAAPYSGIYSPYLQTPLYNSPLAYNYNFGLNYAAPFQVPRQIVAAPAPVLKAAPVVAAPAVHQTVVKAAPVVAAPAPVVHQTVVKAAPVVAAAPVIHQTLVKAAPVVAAPVPVVRQPVVETKTKKVTYTHIGKHPVHPTDVFETEQRVLY